MSESKTLPARASFLLVCLFFVFVLGLCANQKLIVVVFLARRRERSIRGEPALLPVHLPSERLAHSQHSLCTYGTHYARWASLVLFGRDLLLPAID